MRDKYDEAIDYLTESPDEILDAWDEALYHSAGDLFRYCGDGYRCGCLTQVKAGQYEAATPELTTEIRADHRIPSDPESITVLDLPVFAEWQRRMDKMGIR